MQESSSISIDSRTIKPGDIFIPIKGPNFDGHDYVSEVQAKGGKVLDVDLPVYAAMQRQLFDIPIIAITGSSGKTTTKDRIASLLATKFKTLKTRENQNNEIGVPLTLLGLCHFDERSEEKSNEPEVLASKGNYEAAVIELAMRAQGEIEYLTKIVQPTHVVITNIGVAHLGKLGSREAIKQAKCEILLPTKYSQTAFLNQKDDFFTEVSALATKNRWKVISFDEDPLPQIAREFDIDPAIIDTLAVDYSAQRMEIIHTAGLTILNDTYNANPDSVRWAINKLRSYPGRKVAVLGDMLELGEDEVKYHQSIDITGVDNVLTFGPLYQQAGITADSFSEKEELIAKLRNLLKGRDTVLVKGSRGMKMEEIVGQLKKEFIT